MSEDRTWSGATEVLRRNLKTAGMLGMGYQFNPAGVRALEGPLTEMAEKLDHAVRLQLAEEPDRE